MSETYRNCPTITIFDLCDCINNRPMVSLKARATNKPCPVGAHRTEKQPEATRPFHLCVVPDVVAKIPCEILRADFPSGACVRQGITLTPTQVKSQPQLAWKADLEKLYTVMMVDPDAPSRANPHNRYWLHWLVGNVRRNDTRSGTILAEYVGSGPPLNSGLHRYTILVYEQQCYENFDFKKIPKSTAVGRANFKMQEFIKTYKLGDAVAGNFFLAEYDEYVPLLYIQMQVMEKKETADSNSTIVTIQEIN